MNVTFFVSQEGYRDFLKGKSTVAYDKVNRPKRMGSVYLQVTANVQEVEIKPSTEYFYVRMRRWRAII